MNRPVGREVLLETRGLSRLYPDGQVQALRDVSLSIHLGEYVAIMGPSGSGKSTLLTALGAIDRPTTGEVLFAGQPLSQHPNLDALRATQIGFVFQSFHLLPTLTAVENVQIPMFEMPWSSTQRTSRARDLLEQVGMSHRCDHLPSRLSVGERQRVAIARALANRPQLLLADEPTGNLDSQTAEEILALFANLHQTIGMTLVIVTHSDEVARSAQRCIRLRDGRVVEDSGTVVS